MLCLIRRPLTNIYESDENIEFRIRDYDTVYFDDRFNFVKLIFEQIIERKFRDPKKAPL